MAKGNVDAYLQWRIGFTATTMLASAYLMNETERIEMSKLVGALAAHVRRPLITLVLHHRLHCLSSALGTFLVPAKKR